MMKNNSFKEIYEKLISSKKILIPLHTGPDGDCFGSALAMKYFLEKMNIEAKVISYDNLSEEFMEMDFSNEVEFGKDIEDFDFNEFDILLLLDTVSPDMICRVRKNYSIKEGFFKIVIDHHKTNNYYGNLNYIDSDAASTCSILLNFFKDVRFEISKELALRLLIGIYTDSLAFTSTRAVPAIKDAVKLIEYGADYYWFLQNFTFKQRFALKKFFGILLNNLVYDKEGKFGYSIVSLDEIKNLGLNRSEIRLGINKMMAKEFDFVFTLIEMEEGIKGSFRTSKEVDVSKFAQELGGGGHNSAAGFDLGKISLEEAKQKVFDAIKKVNG